MYTTNEWIAKRTNLLQPLIFFSLSPLQNALRRLTILDHCLKSFKNRKIRNNPNLRSSLNLVRLLLCFTSRGLVVKISQLAWHIFQYKCTFPAKYLVVLMNWWLNTQLLIELKGYTCRSITYYFVLMKWCPKASSCMCLQCSPHPMVLYIIIIISC